MAATTLSIDETRPNPNWFPEEVAAIGLVLDPDVSAAAVASDAVEPAEVVADAVRVESVLLELVVDDESEDDVVVVALLAKPGYIWSAMGYL